MMGPNRCYLITLSNGYSLLRVALKAQRAIEYFMETDAKAEFRLQIPAHCRSFGKIVHVEEIFEIEVKPETYEKTT